MSAYDPLSARATRLIAFGGAAGVAVSWAVVSTDAMLKLGFGLLAAVLVAGALDCWRFLLERRQP